MGTFLSLIYTAVLRSYEQEPINITRKNARLSSHPSTLDIPSFRRKLYAFRAWIMKLVNENSPQVPLYHRPTFQTRLSLVRTLLCFSFSLFKANI